MEHQVASQRVKYRSHAVIGEGKTEGEGPEPDYSGVKGEEAWALEAFFFTFLTHGVGTQAAGQEVLGRVANGPEGGPGVTKGVTGATTAA